MVLGRFPACLVPQITIVSPKDGDLAQLTPLEYLSNDWGPPKFPHFVPEGRAENNPALSCWVSVECPSGAKVTCKGDARVIIHRRHIFHRSPQPDGGRADLW